MIMQTTNELIAPFWKNEVKLDNVVRNRVIELFCAIADIAELACGLENNLACARANTVTIVQDAINRRH